MDIEKTLKAASMLRDVAESLIAQAEQLEFQAKIAKAKKLPNGDLIALLIQAGHAKTQSKGH
jgi:ribosomal protein L17